MTSIKQTALAFGTGAALMVGAASGTLAQSHYYEPDDNGTVWPYYRGYTDQVGPQTGQDRRDFAASPRATRRQAPPAPAERFQQRPTQE
jgi:hypothetical protein